MWTCEHMLVSIFCVPRTVLAYKNHNCQARLFSIFEQIDLWGHCEISWSPVDSSIPDPAHQSHQPGPVLTRGHCTSCTTPGTRYSRCRAPSWPGPPCRSRGGGSGTRTQFCWTLRRSLFCQRRKPEIKVYIKFKRFRIEQSIYIIKWMCFFHLIIFLNLLIWLWHIYCPLPL